MEGGTTHSSFLRNSPPPAYNPSHGPVLPQARSPYLHLLILACLSPLLQSHLLEDLLLPIIPPGPEVTLGSSPYCPHSPPTASAFITLAPFISP